MARCNPGVTNSCSGSSEEHWRQGVLKCFHFADFSSVNHTSPQYSLCTPSTLWLFKSASAFQWVMVKLPNMKAAAYQFWYGGRGVDNAAVVEKADQHINEWKGKRFPEYSWSIACTSLVWPRKPALTQELVVLFRSVNSTFTLSFSKSMDIFVKNKQTNKLVKLGPFTLVEVKRKYKFLNILK